MEANGDPECVETNGEPVPVDGNGDPAETNGNPVCTNGGRVKQEISLVGRCDHFCSFRPCVRLFPRIGTRTTTSTRAGSREEE